MNEKDGVCSFCNMIASEDGIYLTRENLEENGWIKKGKQIKHLPDCPHRRKVISGRQAVEIAAREMDKTLDFLKAPFRFFGLFK